MTEAIETPQNEEQAEKKQYLTRKGRIILFALQAIALPFWIYVLVHLFIFDIDAYLISKEITALSILVNYKFLFLIGFIAVFWLFTDTVGISLLAVYILFFPLIFLFWKIPKFLWRTQNVVVTIAFVNIFVSFFKSVKFVFIVASFTIIFSTLIFTSSNSFVLFSSICVLTVLLSIIYIHRFMVMLKPSTIYQIHSKIVSNVISITKEAYKIDEKIKGIPLEKLDEAQIINRKNNLQNLVILNRGCYFLSSKLNDYQKSNFKIIFYIGNLFVLIILTTFIFAVINLGLYKINPSYFQTTIEPNFFIFIYYSISNLFTRGIIEIIPFATISRVFSMIQFIFSFLLLVIIVTLVFSFQSQRDADQINKAIDEIKAQGITVEGDIKDGYKLTVEEAINELERVKSIFIKFIYYLVRSTENK